MLRPTTLPKALINLSLLILLMIICGGHLRARAATPPVPVPDVYYTDKNTRLKIPAPGVLANDYSLDGKPVKMHWTTVGGTTLNRQYDGSITFTPPRDFVGVFVGGYKVYSGDIYNVSALGSIYIFVGGGGACPPYQCAQSSDAGGVRGSFGPSAPDPVNLATGQERYDSDPDLVVYNPSGPPVVWRRSYSNAQGMSGYWSPGLSLGWYHPYDIRIETTPGAWGDLKIIYANGAREVLRPELDAAGAPTGNFIQPPGAPYIARGVVGPSAGVWQSVSITWRDQAVWSFAPHSTGVYALQRLTNRVGRGLQLGWRADRSLSQVSDATSGDVLLTLTYGQNNKLVSAGDAYGRRVTYSFSPPTINDPGRLSAVSQVGDAGANPPTRWTYTYSAANHQQLTSVSVPDPDGDGASVMTINYDANGKVTSLVDANGNRRAYTYNATNTVVQVKDASGAVAGSWTKYFNADRRDTGLTDANGRSTLVEYTDLQNPSKPTRVVGKDGKATTFTYDQFGNVKTVTSPRGVTTTFSYDYTDFALGRLTSVTEGTKPATTFAYYEPSGLVQSVTFPSPAGTGTVTSTYTYDATGNVLTVIGPGNDAASQITTTFDYTTDGSYSQPARTGQPLTVTDNLGHATHRRFDAQGRVISVTDAVGHETNVSYNVAGQVDTVTYPATGQTGTGRGRTVNSYLYPGGPPTAVTAYDESGVQVRQVAYAYGHEGETLSVTGSTEPVSYTYDALYRPKALKDGNDNTTTYGYDAVGNVSSVQMPGGETVQFPSHDPAGRVLRRIDGNGVTTDYAYDDPEGMLTDVRYPATPGLNVHFGYDGYGRRNSMTDGAGGHAYTYGDLDELKSVTTTYTGLSPMTVSYGYNPDGSRGEMVTPAGTFDYSYDPAGRMSSMTNPSYETTLWTYLDNNRLHRQHLDIGVLTTYEYNGRGQITRLLNELDAATLSDFNDFAYDGAGNRKSYAISAPGYQEATGALAYEYDAKDQLKREQSTRGGGFDHAFGYDAAGNPTTFKGETQDFNSNNQRVGSSFSHDSNGNPTTYKGTTLTFDPENRLTSHGTSLTAGYRGDGLRAWRETSQGKTYFLYDGIMPVMEFTPSSGGGALAVNTFGAAGLVSRSDDSGAQGSPATSFYSFDPQGSVSQVISPQAQPWLSPAVSEPQTYTAHGEPLAGTSTPFGYGAQWGYYTDSETGLQLLAHRYYDPAAGRFLTRDPIGYSGGINLYGYVTNSPTGFIDPYGFDKFTLPANPGPNGENLPEGWRKDPDHRSRNGERWISPDGTEGLEFDRGIPGKDGYRGKDHWAKLKPKRWPPGQLEKDDSLGDRGHLVPGDVIDLNSCSVPAPYNPWPAMPNIPPPPPAARLGLGGTIILIIAGVAYVLLA